MRKKIERAVFLVLFAVLYVLTAAPLRAAAGDEPARRLTPRGQENLVAFTRLLGYVRFFHPSDQAAVADWNRVALAGVQRAEKAVNPVDLARTLEEIFQTVAPTVRVFPSGDLPELPAELSPPAGVANPQVTYWEHRGVTLSSRPTPYSSQRVTAGGGGRPPAETGLSVPGEPLVVSLGGGVSALVPLTLYQDAGGTIPQASGGAVSLAPDKPAGFVPSGNDRATRLAGVALAWPVFQHFYPYFDVVPADWAGELPKALAAAAKARGEEPYYNVLRGLVAALQDGHGGVFHASKFFDYQLPITWDWVEGQLVITHTDAARAQGLARGDVVLSLNGRPAQQVLANEERLVSGATLQWRRWQALQNLLQGNPNESVRLKVKRARGGFANVTLRRSFPLIDGFIFLGEPRPEKIAEVRPGIFYVDIDRINDDDFRAALDRLAAAQGIVFDLRGYPGNLTPIVLRHLTDNTIRTSILNLPVITLPDRQGIRFVDRSWNLPPATPRLRAKVAFITDGRAISYAETYMGMVEGHRLAEIVGAPTAGTNGNVNPLPLPGGYTLTWTGMQVLKHDGSQLHGVGILPTVPASRTLKGVTEGRDELLEKALEVVSP